MKPFKDWDGLDWLALLVFLFMIAVAINVILNGVER